MGSGLLLNEASRLFSSATIRQISAADAANVKPGVAKLSDETSRDWMRRYQADCAADKIASPTL